jgi:fructose-1,6-bisphosphatase/inositol monophosphatase family enzyme
MGLSVGENRNLGQSLRAAEGVTAALQHANDVSAGGTDGVKDSAARQVCVAIAEHAEALGLNAFDSAAALWAFASSGGLDAAISTRIWDGDCAAAELARRLHLQLNFRAAEPAEAPPPTPRPTPPVPESGQSSGL